MVYTCDAVAFETDSAGTIGLRYTWGPGADNVLAIQDESGNHYYASADRLGSVRSLARRDGTWLLTRRWSPYGNAINRDSSVTFTWGSRLRYGWTGREYDTETGLYFHRAWYYAPALRRFIQEDPVASSTSAYAYVNGSPLEATDPSGMIMSYEMRMTDSRMDELLAGDGPSGMVDGVSYDGNGGWLNGIVSAGGASEVREPSVADLLSHRTLNVVGVCAAMECPTGMTEHERYALVRDMELAWEGSNTRQKEVAGWLLSHADGDYYLGPLTEGEQDASTVQPAPSNAIAKFHTHPDVAPGIPGAHARYPDSTRHLGKRKFTSQGRNVGWKRIGGRQMVVGSLPRSLSRSRLPV